MIHQLVRKMILYSEATNLFLDMVAERSWDLWTNTASIQGAKLLAFRDTHKHKDFRTETL